MQSPSSLIFLVLLGVWAAYFVQYWVRRRDHVATARSVEQFTEAMRVLERRDPLPRTDLSENAPRSYAVHPARASRPQVLVKRAVASDPAPVGITARIDEGSDAVAPVTAPVPPSVLTSPSTPSPRPVRRPALVTAGPPRVRPSRRVRGLLLLGTLLGLLVIAPLVALSLLPGWVLVPAGLAVAGAFLFVRAGVQAEHRAAVRSRSRRQPDVRRPAAPPAAATGARPTRATASAGAVAAPAAHREGPEVAAVTGAAVAAESQPGPTVIEPVVAAVVEPVEPVEPADVMVVPLVDEDDIPLTWDPVPVPRPTYTMKAKAQRAEVAPAAVTPDPTPVAREGEGDGSRYDERRVAGA